MGAVIATGFSALPRVYPFALCPPNPAIFTQQNFNVGGGVVSKQFNNTFPIPSISLQQADPSGTNNIIAIDKPKLAPTFTVFECLTGIGVGNNQLVGLWYSDGGVTPNCGIVGYDAGVAFRVEIYSSFTNFVGDAFSVDPRLLNLNPAWIGLQETATLRIFLLSSDGLNWFPFFSQAVATNFVTQRYGFAVVSRDGASGLRGTVMGTLLSFSEDNP